MALEEFFGFDTGDKMSESDFEVFKEKIKAAAAQIAQIRKEEKKQKKKEEELLKILMKFVKNSQKKELVALISRALEQNIPANFILAIILLSNQDILEEVGISFMLTAGEGVKKDVNGDGRISHEERENAEEKALIFFKDDETLPLKIKIALDAWLKSLLFQAEENPHKLLKNAYDLQYIEVGSEEDDYGNTRPLHREEKTLKVILVQLIAFILREYLEVHQVPNSYEALSEFARFVITGILEKTRETLDNRKLLED